GAAAPRAADGPVEQPGAEPLPDELGEKPEVGELDLALDAPVELGVPGRDALHVEHEDLDRGVLEDRGERRGVEPSSLVPEPVLADRVVEVAVERGRGADG